MTANGAVFELSAARAARARRTGQIARLGTDGYVAHRFSLDRVYLPRLVRTLEAWQAKAGPDGVFRTSRPTPLTDLAGTEILGVRSMLVTMTGTQPESWLIAFYGRTLVDVTAAQYLGRRFSDLPGTITDASLTTLREVLPEQRPAVHRITGIINGRTLTYDRLVLPVADRTGPVSRFITVSERIDDVREAIRLPV